MTRPELKQPAFPLLEFPDPTDRSRRIVWTGKAFAGEGADARVLAYDVSPSGWTDELTYLHEATGCSNHFIDVASRDHAVSEVSRTLTRTPSIILEVGTSSGFLLGELVQRFPEHRLIGSDYTRGTLDDVAGRVPGVPLVQFDLTKCPLPDNFADVVVLLNVLEHIRDHEAAVAQLFRIVRPGGTVIIEVPAGSTLFDVYDRVLMHERRYDMPALESLVSGAGFRVEKRSHLGFLLFPAFMVAKRLNQWRYPAGSALDEEALVGRMISSTRRSNSALNWVMRIEQGLRSVFPLPRGIRCLITCRKPDGP